MALKRIPIPPKAPEGLEKSWTFLNRVFTNLQRRLPRYRFHSAAQVKLTSNQSIADSTLTALSWDEAVFDDEDLWDSTSPTKFVVPTGFDGKAILTVNVTWGASSTNSRQVTLKKNGSNFDGHINISLEGSSGITTAMNGSTPLIEVSEGDEFEVYVQQDSGSSLNVISGRSTSFGISLYEKSAK